MAATGQHVLHSQAECAIDLKAKTKLRANVRAEIERRERAIAQKAAAERDLLAFVRMMWPIVEPEVPLAEGWLLDMLCETLMAVHDGEFTRLCINVPPGSMKSSLLNVFFPAWEWIHKPAMRYLSISYSTAVPIRDNLRFAAVVKHPVYQTCWGEKVKVVRDGAEWVGNNGTGWKMVTSTGGGVTGFRGDRLLCLPGDARILTDVGWIPIEDIVCDHQDVRVAGWNGNALEWQVIQSYQCNPAAELIVIDYGSGVLRCTRDHPVYVVGRGYVPAASVWKGDVLQAIEAFGEMRPVQDYKMASRTVVDVRTESDWAPLTYNLSASPNHNYFADGILLHNCDDLNNPMDVESDTVRGSTARFVREIMPSRVNDLSKSAIINLQQRTHEMDATGVLLEHGQGYTFVCIPAEFDPQRICRFPLGWDEDGNALEWIDPRALDANGNMLKGLAWNKRGEPVEPVMGSPMAKAAGESFWPERFPYEELQRLRRGMTPYAWDSQFNQIPGVRGGSIIQRHWWKNWSGDEFPAMGTTIVSVDTAYEEGQANDYNAVVVLGAFPDPEPEGYKAPAFMLLAAWQDRIPLAQLVTRVAETCRERKADYLLIEHKTRGRDLHDEIVRQYQNAAWQTVLVKPEGDKASRLQAVSPLFSGDVRRDPVTGIDRWEGGRIWAPDREWSDAVITQVSSFPYAAHDDYVDALSQALGWARKNGVVLRKVEWQDAETDRMRYKRPIVRAPYAIRSD